jgi:hypothetical protein
MAELVKLQQAFFEDIFVNNVPELNFISSEFAQERFNIYRQTIFENMRNALQITFPGIWNLLGEECANKVAFAYCTHEQHLPKSGCLDDFGAEFPDFLLTIKQLQAVPYLRDYAHYEWLKHNAYGAREPEHFSVLTLQNIPEAEIDNIKFIFIPACFLFVSQFPIDAIEKIATGESNQMITLSEEYVFYGIITRTQSVVHTLWIDEILWHFIKHLSGGYCLSDSAKHAQDLNENFDLAGAIAFLLQSQLINNIIR